MKPLVTILIPSFNRAGRLAQLFQSMIDSQINWHDGNWQILVSDNLSTDETQAVLALNSDRLPLEAVSPIEHLETAEENLFYAWQFSKGTFTWILGDDDPINFEAVPRVLDLCRNSLVDAFYWNSSKIDQNGYALRSNTVNSSQKETEMDLRDFVSATGIWYVGASMSCWILRTSSIDSTEAQNWIRSLSSPIYGHVTFFLKALKGKKFKFINFPLVHYRVTTKDEDSNWLKYASRTGVPFRTPWTLGFVKQIQELVDEKCISRNYLRNVLEQHHNGEPFMLFPAMVSQGFDQVARGLRNDEQRFGLDEGNWLIEKFRALEPSYIDFWQALSDALKLSWNGSPPERRKAHKSLSLVAKLWERHRNEEPFWLMRKYNLNGWSVYSSHEGGLIAIPTDMSKELELKIFSGIGIPESKYVLRAVSEDLLDQKIQTVGWPAFDLIQSKQFDKNGEAIFLTILKRLVPNRLKKVMNSWLS